MIIDEFTLEMIKIGFVNQLKFEAKFQKEIPKFLVGKNMPGTIKALADAEEFHVKQIQKYLSLISKEKPDTEFHKIILNLSSDGDLWQTISCLRQAINLMISLLKNNKSNIVRNISAYQHQNVDEFMNHIDDYISPMLEALNFLNTFEAFANEQLAD